jgi:hypothetical protein
VEIGRKKEKKQKEKKNRGKWGINEKHEERKQ